ncbi:MAG: hypothetical protein BGO76_01715 [Caedibacter sp. 38-128]|nr:patatin-like phospholipase family protein [Holosporales bacterium]OJX05131.1 MAG: hypothetical protein BGO76_01715 [Caedibacter sp. 38-128]
MLPLPSASSSSYGFENLKQQLSNLNASEQMSTTVLDETPEEESLTLLHYFKDDLKEKHLTKKRPMFKPSEPEDLYLDPLLKGGTPITYFTALSIDGGGGIRGLIPALLLEYFAKQIPGHYLHEFFDYVGGASTGSLIALGITVPSFTEPDKPHLNPSDIVDLFKNKLKRVFYQPHLYRFFLSPINSLYDVKYGSEKLEALLQESFGKLYLHQSLTNSVIPVLERESSKPFIFDSYHARTIIKNGIDIEIPIWEIGRSAIAYPKYFSEYKLEIKERNDCLFSKVFIDDHQISNPANFVVKHLHQRAGRKHIINNQNTIMLSLGSGFSLRRRSTPINASGVPELSYETLIFQTINAVDATIRQRLLGNYYKVNPSFKYHLCEMDDFRENNIDDLKTVAEAHHDQIDEFIAGDNSIFRKILETGEFRAKPLDQKGKERI